MPDKESEVIASPLSHCSALHKLFLLPRLSYLHSDCAVLILESSNRKPSCLVAHQQHFKSHCLFLPARTYDCQTFQNAEGLLRKKKTLEKWGFLLFICAQCTRGPSGVRNGWNVLLEGTYFTELFITEFKIEEGFFFFSP